MESASKVITSSEILSYLVKGGDTRIDLDPVTHKNRYFLNPLDYKGIMNRGSCTASLLNDDMVRHLQQYEDIDQLEVDFESIRESHAQRIKDLLYTEENPATFHITFTPSGSDSTYIPLLVSKILHPDKDICTLVAAPEEVGTGTIKVTSGEIFQTKTQNGNEYSPGSPLFTDDTEVKCLMFPARDEKGKILDHKKEIKRAVKENKKYSRIGFLVVGSKSGIENNLSIIDECGDDILWVVDLCQFRNPPRLINDLLNKGCMIMITGSKFFQSPPFCGAILVPDSICKKIDKSTVTKNLVKPFLPLFTYYDFPTSLEGIRNFFPRYKNIGLLLRWEVAIEEMTSFSRIDFARAERFITIWFYRVIRAIENSDHLESMPNMDQTNKSIISFRVKKKDKSYLDLEGMKKLFSTIVQSKYDDFGEYNRVFIGQPVVYGEKAFLRVAIGAYNLRKMLETEINFDNDIHLIETIDREAAVFT